MSEKKRIASIVWGLMILCFMTIMIPGIKVEAAGKKPFLNYKAAILPTKVDFPLKMINIGGKKVKWSSTNKKVAKISSKGKIHTLKKGKTVIIAKVGKKKYKCKVHVLSDKQYVTKWCKEFIKVQKISSFKNDFDKIIMASYGIDELFYYGKANGPKEVIWKGQGTCYSGGQLLVELLKHMGYEARVRSANNDSLDMFPDGVMPGFNRHNVEVIINGKKYYVESTPGSGVVYLCEAHKPLYFKMGNRVLVDYGAE